METYISELERKVIFNEQRYNFLKKREDEVVPIINGIADNVHKKYNYTVKPDANVGCCCPKIIPNNSVHVKDLYKKIALKTHPDKSPENIEFFKKALQYYEENDIINLIGLTKKFNIIHDEIPYSDYILLLENKLYEYKTKIKNMQNAVYYNIIIGSKDCESEFEHNYEKIVSIKVDNDKFYENLEKIRSGEKKSDDTTV